MAYHFEKGAEPRMVQKTGIVLIGLNGAGKSTFGKYAAQKLGFDFFEIENYWFRAAHQYRNPRSAEEVSQLLLNDISTSKKGFIIAGNISSLSSDLLPYISLIIYVDVEKDTRVARVIQRDLNIYGELKSDHPLYQERQDFLHFVKRRTADSLLNWMNQSNLPSMIINGNHSLENNLQIIEPKIASQEQKNDSSIF